MCRLQHGPPPRFLGEHVVLIMNKAFRISVAFEMGRRRLFPNEYCSKEKHEGLRNAYFSWWLQAPSSAAKIGKIIKEYQQTQKTNWSYWCNLVMGPLGQSLANNDGFLGGRQVMMLFHGIHWALNWDVAPQMKVKSWRNCKKPLPPITISNSIFFSVYAAVTYSSSVSSNPTFERFIPKYFWMMLLRSLNRSGEVAFSFNNTLRRTSVWRPVSIIRFTLWDVTYSSHTNAPTNPGTRMGLLWME